MALTLTVGTPLFSAVAQAPTVDSVEAARSHFRQGLALFRTGDFANAAVEFERANQLAPSFKLSFNIAQCYAELGRHVDAATRFERFLREGGDDVSVDLRREVEAELQKLAPHVGRLDIVVNVEGASVEIDGAYQGTLPLPGPVVVSPGQRKVTVHFPGRPSLSKQVDVAPGVVLRIDFEMVREARRPSKPRKSSPPTAGIPTERDEPGLGGAFWGALTVTGSLVVGAGVTGYLANSARSQNRDQLETFGVSLADLEASERRARRFALITDVLLGGAAVAGGVTVYLGTAGGTDVAVAGSLPTVSFTGSF